MYTVAFTRSRATLRAYAYREPGMPMVAELPIPFRSMSIRQVFNRGLGAMFREPTGGAYLSLLKDGTLVLPTARHGLWLCRLEKRADGSRAFRRPFVWQTLVRGTDDRVVAALPTSESDVPIWPDTVDWTRRDRSAGLLGGRRWDLSNKLPPDAAPQDAKERFWYVTRGAVVGTVGAGPVFPFDIAAHHTSKSLGRQRPHHDETVANGISVDGKFCYVATSRAVYAFRETKDEKSGGVRVRPVWRCEYRSDADTARVARGRRGQGVSSSEFGSPHGRLSWGSGTTPTVTDRFVYFGDDGTPDDAHGPYTQARVWCVCRETGQVKSVVRPFGDAPAAIENSLAVHGSRVVAGNTFDYVHPYRLRKKARGGIAVLQSDDDGSMSVERVVDVDPMTATMKVAWASERVFGVTRALRFGTRHWKVFAANLVTGQVEYQSIGRDVFPRYDSAWGTVCLLPDDGLVAGVWKGMVFIPPVDSAAT